MAEQENTPEHRTLTRAVWGAAVVVALLLVFVGYLYTRHEAKYSTLINREMEQNRHVQKHDSRNPLPNIVQGELAYRKSDAAQAIKEFKTALEKEPSNPRALVNLGTVYSHQREFDLAAEQFAEVIRTRQDGEFAHIDMYLAEALYQLGHVRAAQNRCGEAIKQFTKTLVITRTDADVHYSIGHCYVQMKKYPEALDALGKAIGFDPEYAEALYDIGISYEKLGRYPEAISAMNRAVVAQPGYFDAIKALRRLNKVYPENQTKGQE